MVQWTNDILKQIKTFSNLIEVENFVQDVILQFKDGNISKEDIKRILNEFGEDYFKNSMQGYAYAKPYGYAGDFKMIDMMYTYHTTDDPRYAIWDEYFHTHAAPQAVRNRKTYFKNFLAQKATSQNNIELLNVASGPARDLFEFYNENKNTTVNTTCVEMDPQAVVYAKALNEAHLNKIDFITANIFKFSSAKQFDTIWSAGLFDYFDDKAFRLILKKMQRWIKPGGEIIIGNFNQDHNPSRDYMEIFGDWYLHHRTEEQLIDLAVQAGFDKQRVWVGQEDERVNLFLHIGAE